MNEPSVIWRSGDPWRDLADDLDGRAGVTVISRSGTARFLDLAGGRHNRLPLEDGRPMWLDTQWRPLEVGSGPGGWETTITPCGPNIVGVLDWAASTPLWAVLDGLWSAAPDIGGTTDWTDTSLGAEIVDTIGRGELPDSGPGHPTEPCGALLCIRAELSDGGP